MRVIEVLVLVIAIAIIVILTIPFYTPQEALISKPAPDFEFTDIRNNKVRLSNFRGRVVLIDFMATWCRPCERQIEILKGLWSKYKDKGVVFMSISVSDRDRDRLPKFSLEHGIEWIVGVCSEAGVKYGITAIPTLVIVDKDGKIVFKHTGVLGADDLAKIIDKALEE